MVYEADRGCLSASLEASQNLKLRTALRAQQRLRFSLEAETSGVGPTPCELGGPRSSRSSCLGYGIRITL
ncbi:hypothetical protein EVAR_11595_1 [Eumeta japonica]|uniref:Uncharacterized protein n=1 Tax=Eumeta variegata TaxID=151549 RepID=A0A4C1X7T6_EUMVA|nr:hypothetical protein EVAR_11595_1 [Eumeta japonica]